MQSYEFREEIEAPIATAWALVSAVEQWPEWLPTVRSVGALQAGPLAIGSRYRLRQPRLPPAVWRVTQLEPGKSFAWESASPGVIAKAEHQLSVRGPRACSVLLRLSLRGPLSGLAAWTSGRIVRDYVALEAQCLRKTAEVRANTS